MYTYESQVSPKRLYSFWINNAEATGLKELKDLEGISESEQIRQAIREYLRKKGVTWRQAPRPRAGTRRRG